MPRAVDRRYRDPMDQITLPELKHNFDMTNSLYALSGFCVGVLVGLAGVSGGTDDARAGAPVGIHPTTAVGRSNSARGGREHHAVPFQQRTQGTADLPLGAGQQDTHSLKFRFTHTPHWVRSAKIRLVLSSAVFSAKEESGLSSIGFVVPIVGFVGEIWPSSELARRFLISR